MCFPHSENDFILKYVSLTKWEVLIRYLYGCRGGSRGSSFQT